MDHAQQQGMSERWACRVVKQPRGTQRYRPTQREDEDRLTQAIVVLAGQYGRYGYRRITALLVHAGWKVGKDRVERIWRREGLKVPKKQKPRGRLWLNDGSCVRLRPAHRNHVWSYDFVSVRTHDGRTARALNLIDEHTREALVVRVERRWSSAKVPFSPLMTLRPNWFHAYIPATRVALGFCEVPTQYVCFERHDSLPLSPGLRPDGDTGKKALIIRPQPSTGGFS